ncbi:MAG: glycosyltransferase family 39 protein, partial [Phycisphaerales bacterium]|nr:glycosyltransferase family 39 protein [Phycisphaerales bacterium]
MLVLLTWATEGVYPLAVLAAAAGYGAWPARWLLRGDSPAKRWTLATALGLGALVFLTLALGLLGVMGRIPAWGLVGLGVVMGCVALSREDFRRVGDQAATGVKLRVVLMIAGFALPATVGFIGATLPPGVLWVEEGRGYDALEYHLQAPREFYDADRITFLPHNVYASFPQQMETLYLLLMQLRGDAQLAAIPAQMLHLLCGALAIVAIGVWSPPGWPRLVATLTAVSAPWLVIVGTLAYVELGMLLFTAVACGLLLDQLRAERPDTRAMIAAGMAAGLACGCKYTAIVLIAIAGWVSWMLLARAAWRNRAIGGAVFAVAAALTFAPWAARNVAFTGDPVYPFGWRVFHGAAWSDAQVEQWARGHRVPPESASVAGRAKLAMRELFGSFERSGPPSGQAVFR